MSKFVEDCAMADVHLSNLGKHLSADNNIAAAQAHALLALAEAVRDVADAIRGKERQQ